jgi:hypothetical protein
MPDAIIIGAGLAGLSAAMELSQRDIDVLVLEKKSLPRHKVCGEYLSREVLPYFEKMGVPFPDRPVVDQFLLSTSKGRYVQRQLPLGGVGISRKTLDALLCEHAKENGARIEFHTKVQEVYFKNNAFHLTTAKGDRYKAQVVLSAFGKGPGWRSFSEVKDKDKAVYLGVKQYYRYEMPEDLVVLHNFEGGYCGAVKVEDGTVDVAYMVDQAVFRRFKSTELLEEELMHVNPFLKELFIRGEAVLERPMTISNFQLGSKKLIEEHILYAGDAAAMIPPASGNGMAMAIWGGHFAANAMQQYLHQKCTREQMEKMYRKQWKKHLSNRLLWGRQFQRLMGTTWPAEWAMSLLKAFPSLLSSLVSLTHSKKPQL